MMLYGSRLRLVLLAVFALVLAVSGRAQFGAGVDVRYNPALLMNPVVQQDLGLSPDASGKVMNVMMTQGMKLMPLMQNRGGGSSAEFAKKAAAAYKEMESETVKLLTPKQRARLEQLTLQSIGPNAVAFPRVASALGLTAAQKSKINTALGEVAKKSVEGMNRGAGRPDPNNFQAFAADMAKRQDEAKKAGDKVLKATLTPAQLKKWDALLGKRIPLAGFAGMGNFGGFGRRP